ncbi:MAG: phosphodiester glycosidase family protein [Acidaminococcales bacterium]|jgi:exopolysaccharide biosynthesis protein|nr:phosphodiester glycosidase family protein [Acidaminococcales bacterium]
MRLFLRRAAVFLLTAVLLLWPCAAQAALVVKDIRYSDSAEKTRVVLDINENVTLAEAAGFGNRIALEIGAGAAGEDVKDIILSGRLLRQVKLFKIKDGRLLLDIMLGEETAYSAFVLKEPWRLVVDIFKNYDIKNEETIAPGLVYTNIRRRAGERVLKMHYLTVDKSRWRLRPAMANREALRRDSLKNIIYDNHAAAGVNASYFDRDGWVIGNLKINGEIVAGEERGRTALLIYQDESMEFALTDYYAQIVLPDKTILPVKGVNRARLADDLVVYESSFARRVKASQPGCDVIIDKDGKVLALDFTGDVVCEKDEVIISGHGAMADYLSALKPGDTVVFSQSMGDQADKAAHVLGAGPRLIDTGRIVSGGNPEDFPPDIMNGRAPRTAVGINGKGDAVLFVADGRSKESAGLTLWEAAEELLAFGVVDAMNLDGGGSSEMVIGSQVMNSPSDKQERKISVALAVAAKPPEP